MKISKYCLVSFTWKFLNFISYEWKIKLNRCSLFRDKFEIIKCEFCLLIVTKPLILSNIIIVTEPLILPNIIIVSTRMRRTGYKVYTRQIFNCTLVLTVSVILDIFSVQTHEYRSIIHFTTSCHNSLHLKVHFMSEFSSC